MIRWLCLMVVAAAVTHGAIVLAFPYMKMAGLADRSAGPQVPMNTIGQPPRIDETQRRVVRPSPDLAYSACPFHLDDTVAMEVMAPDTAGYMSFSLFAANTDNFFVRNDQQIGDEGLHVLLVAEGVTVTNAPPGAEIVTAPTSRGLGLFRRVIPSDDAWELIDAQRRQAVCRPFSLN